MGLTVLVTDEGMYLLIDGLTLAVAFGVEDYEVLDMLMGGFFVIPL